MITDCEGASPLPAFAAKGDVGANTAAGGAAAAASNAPAAPSENKRTENKKTETIFINYASLEFRGREGILQYVKIQKIIINFTSSASPKLRLNCATHLDFHG